MLFTVIDVVGACFIMVGAHICGSNCRLYMQIYEYLTPIVIKPNTRISKHDIVMAVIFKKIMITRRINLWSDIPVYTHKSKYMILYQEIFNARLSEYVNSRGYIEGNEKQLRTIARLRGSNDWPRDTDINGIKRLPIRTMVNMHEQSVYTVLDNLLIQTGAPKINIDREDIIIKYCIATSGHTFQLNIPYDGHPPLCGESCAIPPSQLYFGFTRAQAFVHASVRMRHPRGLMYIGAGVVCLLAAFYNKRKKH